MIKAELVFLEISDQSQKSTDFKLELLKLFFLPTRDRCWKTDSIKPLN